MGKVGRSTILVKLPIMIRTGFTMKHLCISDFGSELRDSMLNCFILEDD